MNKYLVTQEQLQKLCELARGKRDLELINLVNSLELFSSELEEASVEIPQGAPIRNYGEQYGMFGDSKPEYVIPEKKPELNTDEIELGRYKTVAANKLSEILKAQKESIETRITVEDDHWMSELVKKNIADEIERLNRAFLEQKIRVGK